MGNRLATPQSVSIVAHFHKDYTPYSEAVAPADKVDLLAQCVDFGLRAVEAHHAALESGTKPLPESYKFFIDIDSRSPLLLRHWQAAIGEAVRDWRAERKEHVAWTILLWGDDCTNLHLYRLRYTLCITTGPFDTGHFKDVNNHEARIRLL